ncbi:MAG: hypothetical protein KDE03_17695 [Rhodobacteraceae bacterium]|nr:hypothetical protein [Paracoccaceae bacterium]
MIRRLVPGDFDALWQLGLPFIDPRLKPDRVAARDHYRLLIALAGVFAEGEIEDGSLTGAVIATSNDNCYAKKGHARMELWIGGLHLLDHAISWWEGRPRLRALHLQFPNNVRPAMYRALKMRGFERSGDMNLLWR